MRTPEVDPPQGTTQSSPLRGPPSGDLTRPPIMDPLRGHPSRDPESTPPGNPIQRTPPGTPAKCPHKGPLSGDTALGTLHGNHQVTPYRGSPAGTAFSVPPWDAPHWTILMGRPSGDPLKRPHREPIQGPFK